MGAILAHFRRHLTQRYRILKVTTFAPWPSDRADASPRAAIPLALIFDRKHMIIKVLLARLTRRKASVGLFFLGTTVPAEPAVKRAIAFVDGQNLFHNARNAFGYTYPNYDVQKLARAVCAGHGWTLDRVQFYTGVPSAADDAFWHGFWSNKLAMMGRRGVVVYSRPLVYRNKTIHVPGFGTHSFLSGEEKGIDVRLALDALDAAHRNQLDVILIFSQDQDLSELASLIRLVAGFQNRWIKIASAFPDSADAANRRGINRTDWCRIDKSSYDTCIDPRDYRPKL